jgi:hypothetical protein
MLDFRSDGQLRPGDLQRQQQFAGFNGVGQRAEQAKVIQPRLQSRQSWRRGGKNP